MRTTPFPAAAAQTNPLPSETKWLLNKPLAVILILALHVPLGLLADRYAIVSTAHALLTLAVGLIVLVSRPREDMLYVFAYLIGAEVFWRMTEADIFWEFGKYATVFLCLLTLLKIRHFKLSAAAIIYFLLLLPSAIITITNQSFDLAKDNLSYYLSGPLALMIAASTFTNFTITNRRLNNLFFCVIPPVVSVAAIAAFWTMNNNVEFIEGSLKSTSGGFGPNQVSSVLGMGVLFCFLLGINREIRLASRFIFFGLLFAFFAQSGLTLSRNGLYLAVFTIGILTLVMVKNRLFSPQTLIVMAIIFAGLLLFVIPSLQEITGGVFANRFQNTNLTGRDLIVQADILAFKENPIAGVGPGLSVPYHAMLFRETSAHTEFSRMLAEHGLFGLFSLLVLLLAIFRNFSRTQDPFIRAVFIAFCAYSLAYMSVNAMRLVIPSFMIGITFARVAVNEVKQANPVQNTQSHPPVSNS